MRIDQIYVDGYGALHDVSLELNDGLVCVHGPNEAGKSTLLAFIRSVFFGFSSALTHQISKGPGRAKIPFDPVQGNKGGHLVLTVEDGEHQEEYRVVRRIEDRKDGELTVEDLTRGHRMHGPEAERRVRKVLRDADATVFSNVFAIGLDELHELNSLSRSEVQAVLFTGGAGVGAELVPEMETLRTTLEELYTPRGQKKPINLLQKELAATEKEIRQARTDLKAYQDKRERLEELEHRLWELGEQRAEVHLEAERASQRQLARVHLTRINDNHERLQDLKRSELPDDGAAADEKQHWQDVKKWTDRLNERQHKSDKTRKEARGLVVDEPALTARTHLQAISVQDLTEVLEDGLAAQQIKQDIEALSGPHVEADVRERHKDLEREIQDVERALTDLDNRHGALAEKADTARKTVLFPAVEADMENVLREDVTELRRRVEEAQEETKEEQVRLRVTLRRLGHGWDEAKLRSAPVDTELAKLKVALPGDLPGPRAATTWKATLFLGVGLAVIGVAAVPWMGFPAGGLLVASGLVASLLALWQRPVAAVQGLNVPESVGSALRGLGLDVMARSDFEAFCSSLQGARKACTDQEAASARAKRSRDALEAAEGRLRRAATAAGLSPEGQPSEVRMHIEARLKSSRQAAAAREHHDSEIQKLEIAREQDRKRHQRLVEEAEAVRGTYDTTVKEFPTLVEVSERRDALREALKQHERGAARFKRIQECVAQAAEALGRGVPSQATFVEVVPRWIEEAENAHETQRRLADVEKAIGEHEADVEDAERCLAEARGEWQELLTTFGCEDHGAFLEAFEAARTCTALLADLEREKRDLKVIASRYPTVGEDAAASDPDQDERRIQGRDEEVKTVEAEIQRLREDSDDLKRFLDQADSSDRLGALHAHRKALDAEMHEATEQWAKLRLVEFLLQRTRETYEREHGPKVLQRAGTFLARITDGRYVGIQRSLEGEGYQLLRPNSAKPLDAVPPIISRSTFAQVYLCVRLAYTDVAEDHARLPYVLDDVLSDFDEGRLRRVVEVLLDLAQSRQVILFTHHAHVANTCRDLGVGVKPIGANKMSARIVPGSSG